MKAGAQGQADHRRLRALPQRPHAALRTHRGQSASGAAGALLTSGAAGEGQGAAAARPRRRTCATIAWTVCSVLVNTPRATSACMRVRTTSRGCTHALTRAPEHEPETIEATLFLTGCCCAFFSCLDIAAARTELAGSSYNMGVSRLCQRGRLDGDFDTRFRY